MNKFINFSVLILIICILLGDVFYILTDSLLVKSLTSLGFVLIGVLGLIFAFKNKSNNKKFIIVMLLGLIFAMLGDIVLEIEFIIGAILFAVGHVFFFISYCFLKEFSWKEILVSSFIFIPATALILFLPIFDFGGLLMKIICVAYAIIISFMTGKAISNYVKLKNKLTLVIMIGSILFLFSDLMLLFNVFSNISKIFGYLCLITYYPAEILLAISLFLTKKSNN